MRALADQLIIWICRLTAWLILPRWHERRDLPDLPKRPGWYQVRISGDSESIDGFTIYSYPDYTTWAKFHPPEDVDGTGAFYGIRDAWCGPFAPLTE